MALIIDKAVSLTANSLNKTLYQAIVDGDFSGGGGGGTSIVEVFNNTITLGARGATITGVNYFKAPAALSLGDIKLQIFTKNGTTTGNLSIDIKKNTSPDNVGMISIFSAQPTINFATATDYAEATGTKSTSSVAAGEWLRLDITSIPNGFRGTISVMVYA